MKMHRAGVISIVVGILVLASSFDKRTDRELRSREANILVRDLGHRILLLSGDASSRVLPVKEIGEGIFQLRFEKELAFTPDSLMALSKRILPESKFASGFILTVHDCLKAGIVYGFKVNHTEPDVLACRGREFPAGCYLIEIAFPDFYAKPYGLQVGDEKQNKTDGDNARGTDQLSTPVHTDKQSTENSRAETANASLVDAEVNDRASASTGESVNVNNPAQAENKILYIAVAALLLGAVVLFVRFRKNPKAITNDALQKGINAKRQDLTRDAETLSETVVDTRHEQERIDEQEHKRINPEDREEQAAPVQHQQQHEQPIAVAEPQLPSLGKFLFDVKRQTLVSGNELIPLTDKECHVLELLHRDFGELVTRDTLMQEVWINEGVITGRSLDMFVSKLRKKLSSDDDLRITNVHGKGYRLESAPGIA